MIKISQVRIFISALLRAKRSEITDAGKNKIIMPFHFSIGDIVVASVFIESVAEAYCDKEVIVLAKKGICKFAEDAVPLSGNVSFEPFDFERYSVEYGYYKSMTARYSDKADMIIAYNSTPVIDIFTASCYARKKMGMQRLFHVKWPMGVVKLLEHAAYTDFYIPDDSTMMLERNMEFLEYLKIPAVNRGFPKLKSMPRFIETEHYVVIAPGASTPVKCWPADHWGDVINYIISRYKVEVHICGSSDEAETEERIISNVTDRTMVKAHCGKLNFTEWCSLIQHADLLVTNDSAPVHIRAAYGKKNLCICGAYEPGVMFPYRMRNIDANVQVPEAIIVDMPCAGCSVRGGRDFSDVPNEECRGTIKQHGCALCVEMIEVAEVRKKIDELMKDSAIS